TGDVFSVGGDTSPDRPYVTYTGLTPIDEARLIIDGIIDLQVPFICAVNGHAIGLGSTIASLSDVSFVVPGAKFGDPHVLAGLPAGNGSALIWPLLVGVNTAKKLLMTGEIMTSDTAVSLGLLSEVVTDGDVLDAALDFAATMVALPPQAVQGTKATIHLLLRAAADLLMDFSLNAEREAMNHPDFLAALEAMHQTED
ncbi:MAG: enoyl-CoA hydratase/isomerase family protein, partial [Acidimicrobiales bacterium]|nr:enoyl-CoA hydratase/isomerase family protein [Acidimicrobiales bacterium]